jgi:glycosyltransferase involved in cell wall biosynthesis
VKFSILIANYNNGRFFQDCWNSLLAQSYQNWEAVIVDDCSTDNSMELISTIIKGDERVILVKNEKNQGCGYTKVQTTDLATGDLFAFLDPDDTLEINALEVMLNAFSGNENLSLVYSKHRRYDATLTNVIHEHQFRDINTRDPLYFNLGGIVTAFAVFRKTSYQQTTGIDPYMLRGVDQDLYLKLFEVGDTKGVDQFLYKYRVHGQGISTGNEGVNAVKAEYWHWYAINAAAKRRGVYVEDLFTKVFAKKNAYDYLSKEYGLLKNSRTYKLGQKIAGIAKLFGKK